MIFARGCSALNQKCPYNICAESDDDGVKLLLLPSSGAEEVSPKEVSHTRLFHN